MRISLCRLNLYLFLFTLEGATDRGSYFEEIQVIKPAFFFLFEIKLFQLLFWLDFELVNEKTEEEVQRREIEEWRRLVTWACRTEETQLMSREQVRKEPVVSQEAIIPIGSSLCCKSRNCKLVHFPVKLKSGLWWSHWIAAIARLLSPRIIVVPYWVYSAEIYCVSLQYQLGVYRYDDTTRYYTLRYFFLIYHYEILKTALLHLPFLFYPLDYTTMAFVKSGWLLRQSKSWLFYVLFSPLLLTSSENTRAM